MNKVLNVLNNKKDQDEQYLNKIGSIFAYDHDVDVPVFVNMYPNKYVNDGSCEAAGVKLNFSMTKSPKE